MGIWRKCNIFLVILCMLFLGGCSQKEHISLEDALLAAANDRTTTEESTEVPDGGETPEEFVYVYICGAVQEPGVYTLSPGSRIVAAVEAAGGFLPEAAIEAVNLAEPVTDGMQIIVPDLEEYSLAQATEAVRADGKLNLNTASKTELCSLNGIGETKAEAILAYRTEIGSFTSIEQLKEVSGIGDSLFQQIKECIYIE